MGGVSALIKRQDNPCRCRGLRRKRAGDAVVGIRRRDDGESDLRAIFSHVQTQDPHLWNEVMNMVGSTELYVQQNTWDPATCGSPGCIPSTGWHTHAGPSFVIVTQGSVTAYDGDDPACAPHVYTAGTPDNAFIDPGDGHVHIIRDESGAVAKTIAVQFVAAGAARRQDTPDPGNCPF